MQGIVFDVKRFAVHDGPGIRTTIFLKGCNMRCFWCHNPESMDKEPFVTTKRLMLDGICHEYPETIGKVLCVNDVMEMLERERVFMDESGGGVTFSGGEPTIQFDFLLSLLIESKTRGFHTAVDTNGMAPQSSYRQIMPYTDLFLFDIKDIDTVKHQEKTGVSNERILQNLQFLLENNAHVWVRVPIVPNFNYHEADIEQIADFLSNLEHKPAKIDLLPYHAMAQNKFARLGMYFPLADTKGLEKKNLQPFKQLFERHGFTTTIGG